LIIISRHQFLSLRFDRQFFLRQADKIKYDAFFRDVSPVNTTGWCEPGHPPAMPPHAAFNDDEYNFALRADRKILKGHFGGRVGYVAAEDLQLFACLYCHPVTRLSQVQHDMYELIRTEGPLNIGSIKEITGLQVKNITPVLRRLQEAFLLFEDQADNEGDRAWYIFEDEFPDINLGSYSKTDVLTALLPRIAHRAVFFTDQTAKRFYSQQKKDIQAALDRLILAGTLTEASLDGIRGYVLSKDAALLSSDTLPAVPPGVIVVQRNDFIARCTGYVTGSEWDTLYYLLIDGDIRGAVCGRFRFGPHDIEDIKLDLPADECAERKNEILGAVYTIFDYSLSPWKRYNGEKRNG
jgi:hypothetical protein